MQAEKVAGSLNSTMLKFCVVSSGKKVLNTAKICDKLSVKKLRTSFLFSVRQLQQCYISMIGEWARQRSHMRNVGYICVISLFYRHLCVARRGFFDIIVQNFIEETLQTFKLLVH